MLSKEHIDHYVLRIGAPPRSDMALVLFPSATLIEEGGDDDDGDDNDGDD